MAAELVDDVGDVDGSRAAGGGLAGRAVLAGEHGGVGEGEGEGEGGDCFGVHLAPGGERWDVGGDCVWGLTAVVSVFLARETGEGCLRVIVSSFFSKKEKRVSVTMVLDRVDAKTKDEVLPCVVVLVVLVLVAAEKVLSKRGFSAGIYLLPPCRPNPLL